MRKISFCFLLCLISFVSRADEGMWLVNLLEKNLTRQMKTAGLRLDPRLIYDEDLTSLSDAVVSMEFGCTGSMISQEGLLITNHHCAYSDIHAFSTPDANYLEEGFWASSRKEEKCVPGKSVFFLRKAYDVTDRVIEMRDKQNMGSRKYSSVLEKEYKELTGCECMLASMWGGTKYYMYCYQQYKDVRLVGAPPVSIAAYGGEADNWNWPQHKGDFALYRIYTAPDGSPAEYAPENVPLVPKNTLNVSAKGIKNGSYAMVMGYPYSTNRYNSSYGIERIQKETYPIQTQMGNKRLEIMNKWMEQDPAIRLQYADVYFSVANVTELRGGEVLSLTRHQVAAARAAEEAQMQQWIEAQAQTKEQWGDLLSTMKRSYEGTKDITVYAEWFRQTLVSCPFITMGRRVTSMRSDMERHNRDTIGWNRPDFKELRTRWTNFYKPYNPLVEKEWFFYALDAFCKHVPRTFWGEYLNGLYDDCNQNAEKVAQYVWDNSHLQSFESFCSFLESDIPTRLILDDPAFLLAQSVPITAFTSVEKQILGDDVTLTSMATQYKHATYAYNQARNLPQYPDANGTMRLTFGNVGPLYPQDGIRYEWYSTTQGILDKWNPADYEFLVNDRMQSLLAAKDWGRWVDRKDGTLHVNFICDLDITGGNSGSPVMNDKGQLIGLAFDGNKESLAGDTFFHKDLNKCVCVDIRYVLWVIEKYAQKSDLLNEMNIIY